MERVGAALRPQFDQNCAIVMGFETQTETMSKSREENTGTYPTNVLVCYNEMSLQYLLC